MRIGILGGSFNPPHRGHLALAETVLALGLADRVRLVPAASPPHKRIAGEVAAGLRLAMTELLAREDGRLSVDGLELEREGPSYTVDTLREFRERRPEAEYRLIIGSDMAKSFGSWREYREVLRLAPPLVAERPDDRFRGSGDYGGMPAADAAVLEAGRFAMEPVAVSSTLVRERIAAGAGDAEILRYVTEPVLAFIRERRLYAGVVGA